MKGFVFLLLVIGVAFAAESLTGQLRNVDISQLLENDRLLTNYIKCLLDQGRCTHDGRELKKTLPIALKSNCSKCDGNTKSMVEKVIHHLKTKRPMDWAKLLVKYDPHGEYKKRFETVTSSKKP